MIALMQRVSEAKVTVDQNVTGAIGRGLLVFLGVEAGDTHKELQRLSHKVLGYRVFPDDDGKMNLSVADIGAELLVVSQFTLAAETKKGMRPGFSSAATPALAEALYHDFIADCQAKGITTASGQFGADMQVSLVNDGPVTFWLQV